MKRLFFTFVFITSIFYQNASYSQSEDKTFYIVISSHKDVRNAVKYKEELSLRNVLIGKTYDKKFFVTYYKVSENIDETLKLKRELTKRGIGKNIWISTGITPVSKIELYNFGINTDFKTENTEIESNYITEIENVFPLFKELKSKEIIEETSGNEIFLGFYKDPKKVKQLKVLLDNFKNLETVYASTKNRDYFSLKIKNINDKTTLEDVVDMLNDNFKGIEYSIGNNYLEEISENEMTKKEPEVIKEEKEPETKELLWYKNTKIYIGAGVFSLQRNLMKDVFFSDYIQFGNNVTTDTTLLGALKIKELQNKKSTFINYATVSVAYVTDKNTEVVVGFKLGYQKHYDFIYNPNFGANFFVINQKKLRVGISPRIGIVYGNKIKIGSLEAVNGRNKSVILNQSIFIKENQTVYSKMFVVNSSINLLFDYNISKLISFFAKTGFQFSSRSNNFFRFKNNKSFTDFPNNDRSVVNNPYSNKPSSPEFNHQSLGIDLSFGIVFKFLDEQYKDQRKTTIVKP